MNGDRVEVQPDRLGQTDPGHAQGRDQRHVAVGPALRRHRVRIRLSGRRGQDLGRVLMPDRPRRGLRQLRLRSVSPASGLQHHLIVDEARQEAVPHAPGGQQRTLRAIRRPRTEGPAQESLVELGDVELLDRRLRPSAAVRRSARRRRARRFGSPPAYAARTSPHGRRENVLDQRRETPPRTRRTGGSSSRPGTCISRVGHAERQQHQHRIFTRHGPRPRRGASCLCVRSRCRPLADTATRQVSVGDDARRRPLRIEGTDRGSGRPGRSRLSHVRTRNRAGP